MAPEHMTGIDVDIWGKTGDADNHPPDIVCVHPRDIPDKFSRVVSERAIYLFKYGMHLVSDKLVFLLYQTKAPSL